MRRVKQLCVAILSLGGILFTCTGCGLTAPAVQEPPSPGRPMDKTLQELQGRIVANSRSFASLKADVDVALRSNMLRSPAQLDLSGKLALKRAAGPDGAPRTQIYLYLEKLGRMRIELVGDGQNYTVNMPVLDDQYSNSYNAPLKPGGDRIHFMPDDLAGALVPTDMFYQSSQVLKSYPTRWNLMAGSVQNPLVSPPEWIIDSIQVSDAPDPKAWVQSSLVLDRKTEQVVRLDKFRPDGTLRMSAWYLNPGVVRGSDGEAVNVPGEIMMWYPPPLENTVIRIRLKNRKVNVPIHDSTFEVKD